MPPVWKKKRRYARDLAHHKVTGTIGLKPHQTTEACGVAIDWVANLEFFLENKTTAHIEAYVFPLEAKDEILEKLNDQKWLISMQLRRHVKRHVLSKEETLFGLHSFNNLQSGNLYVFRLTGRKGGNTIDLRSNLLEVPRMPIHDKFIIDKANFPHGVKVRNPQMEKMPPITICYQYSDNTRKLQHLKAGTHVCEVPAPIQPPSVQVEGISVYAKRDLLLWDTLGAFDQMPPFAYLNYQATDTSDLHHDITTLQNKYHTIIPTTAGAYFPMPTQPAQFGVPNAAVADWKFHFDAYLYKFDILQCRTDPQVQAKYDLLKGSPHHVEGKTFLIHRVSGSFVARRYNMIGVYFTNRLQLRAATVAVDELLSQTTILLDIEASGVGKGAAEGGAICRETKKAPWHLVTTRTTYFGHSWPG